MNEESTSEQPTTVDRKAHPPLCSTDLLGRWSFVKPSQIESLDAWILWEWWYKTNAGKVHGFRLLGWQKEWLDNAN